MRNLYFFILGRNPTLSIAEIFSKINERIRTNFFRISNEFLILETKNEINIKELQEELGGTIKIGKILTQIEKNLEEINLNLFLNELPKNKKVFFGFSLYQSNKSSIKDLRFKIKDLALTIKRKLKENGISSRWVISKERTLSSVIVKKNKLLNQGAEFNFLVEKNKIYLGKTLTCQEFEEYEKIDFNRPARKIEKGMIPLKLAKIMINLAMIEKDKTILDPFCGSGTILQEAILMSYKKIIGTDVSQEAIENTQKNLNWLFENLKLNSSKLKIEVKKTDVRNLSQKISPNSIEAIITEPYLGPIKISNFKFKLLNELSNLYLSAFQEFKKVLKKDGRVVIIFPIFKIKNKLHFLPILEELKKTGWQIINPIPKILLNNPVIKITERNSIIYSRPDQKILREIFIFKM